MMVAPMPLRILLLEDVPADAALIERHLTKSGLEFVSQRVDTRARFEQALREFVPDIILSDHGLPGFDGSAALELVNERFPTLPVILVTGSQRGKSGRVHEGGRRGLHPEGQPAATARGAPAGHSGASRRRAAGVRGPVS